MRGLSLVAASGGHSSSRCAGLSLSRPLLLRSTGSRRASSVVVAHGLSCSVVCGIFPDQGSNPCPLHWQADSQPLRHQGSPRFSIFNVIFIKLSLNYLLTCFYLFSSGLVLFFLLIHNNSSIYFKKQFSVTWILSIFLSLRYIFLRYVFLVYNVSFQNKPCNVNIVYISVSFHT